MNIDHLWSKLYCTGNTCIYPICIYLQ